VVQLKLTGNKYQLNIYERSNPHFHSHEAIGRKKVQFYLHQNRSVFFLLY